MVTSTESDNGIGDGNTVDDALPPAGGNSGVGPGDASQDHLLRAERSGTGDGRVYTIDVDAKFDAGANDCQAEFKVYVPHDLRGGRFN
jgi:endo-1,4-beta-xylanase